MLKCSYNQGSDIVTVEEISKITTTQNYEKLGLVNMKVYTLDYYQGNKGNRVRGLLCFDVLDLH